MPIKHEHMTKDAAAQMLLDDLYELDSAWRERDNDSAAEMHESPAERAKRYMALVLDQGLHMNAMTGYEYISSGVARDPGRPMHGTCPQCDKEFNRAYPGQVCCGNECAALFFPPPKMKTAEYDDSFERAMAQQAQTMEDNRPPDTIPVSRGGTSMPTSGNVR